MKKTFAAAFAALLLSVMPMPSLARQWTLQDCIFTGVFFGWYPAKKAAMLDPIEAIRYE